VITAQDQARTKVECRRVATAPRQSERQARWSTDTASSAATRQKADRRRGISCCSACHRSIENSSISVYCGTCWTTMAHLPTRDMESHLPMCRCFDWGFNCL